MNPQEPIIPQEPKSNNLAIITMAIFIIASLSTTAFFYYQNQELKKMLMNYQIKTIPTPTIFITPTPVALESPTATSSAIPKASMKACTMEAKLCPDGSYVGRTGPNCEFSPCPTPISN